MNVDLMLTSKFVNMQMASESHEMGKNMARSINTLTCR